MARPVFSGPPVRSGDGPEATIQSGSGNGGGAPATLFSLADQIRTAAKKVNGTKQRKGLLGSMPGTSTANLTGPFTPTVGGFGKTPPLPGMAPTSQPVDWSAIANSALSRSRTGRGL